VGAGRVRSGVDASRGATQRPEYFREDWHDPKAMYARAEETISDEEFRESYIVGSDPEVHAERIREVERMGATVVCLQNGSGAAPLNALEVYGEKVLRPCGTPA
jgi:coenzyme F420-dependent glucose-6-phosphate dehydrogenase